MVKIFNPLKTIQYIHLQNKRMWCGATPPLTSNFWKQLAKFKKINDSPPLTSNFWKQLAKFKKINDSGSPRCLDTQIIKKFLIWQTASKVTVVGGGGGDNPHHILLFCKSVYIDQLVSIMIEKLRCQRKDTFQLSDAENYGLHLTSTSYSSCKSAAQTF